MKTKAGQPPMQQPQLPTLPSLQTLEDDCAHSSGESTVLLTSDSPPENKMKSGLGDLFGDVFVTKVVPGKSMFQIVESGLANYKVEETMPLNSNPLLWWKAKELKYPILSKLAKGYLCVPATSVASERVVSSAGDLVSAQRSCLHSEHVDKLIFLTKNQRVH